ncbi:5-formyltetrahydrofolate cyclo-ligase [Caulobacter sp. KR2-114]|uniref:5-formyltetrahydrofolate cyclo-ligase n=1 Tax=Caulobacter sp. KR2-114 TaxID=3400912 RepID=UPI003C0AFF85
MRRILRARRRALAVSAPQAAALAAAALPTALLGRFAVVGGYHALGAEMDPAPLIARLAEHGALTALPAAAPDAPLVFRLVRPGDVPAPDAFGIPSPPPQAPEAAPDLLIAPLLGFDAAGGRLGQGGGHYDRTIAAIRAVKPLFVLGLAFAGQEVAHLDMEPHDQRLDAILTETGYREVRKDF